MAATTSYHRLPQDNRPSTDSDAADDERLLGPFHDDDDAVPQKKVSFSFHPTTFTRLITFALLIAAEAFLFRPGVLPCAIIILFALIRNAMVLLQGVFCQCVRIRVEFVNGTYSPTIPPARKDRIKWSDRRVQIGIDLLIWATLFISVTVVGLSFNCRMGYWSTHCHLFPPTRPGIILAWTAVPFYLFSLIDCGSPKSVTITTSVAIDSTKKREDTPPQAHGALAGSPRKTRADLTVVV